VFELCLRLYQEIAGGHHAGNFGCRTEGEEADVIASAGRCLRGVLHGALADEYQAPKKIQADLVALLARDGLGAAPASASRSAPVNPLAAKPPT